MAHTYQLSARMESGEVSELFRGLQDHGREVTLKLFSPRFSDPEYARALGEASKKVGNLGHPSIIHYEDIGVVQGRLGCARAHLDGYHLGTALSRLNTKEVVLPAPVALQIAVEVMIAVGTAHQAGIVHGALTPANVVVTREGRVFVTDFMALWAMRQSPALKALADRGRQAYRAPELGRGFEPDPGADVYSVGAILYELLTLREVAGSRAGGVSTRRDALTPPSRLTRNVNARLDPLVLRALEPLKSRRQKNCLEMAEAFQAYLAAQGAAPGRMEIAKFVNEVFPNEVQVAGSAAELPLKGEFTLEPVEGGLSLPGLKIDVAERVSYSASSIDAAELPELPGDRASDKTMHDESSVETTEPPKPKAVSAWDAPPGVLDPAVQRKVLSSPRMASLVVDETQPLPRETESARRRRPVENFTADSSRTDVTTNPQPPASLLAQPSATATIPGPPPPSAAEEKAKPRVARPRKELPEEPERAPNKPDWHAKPKPPRPQPKPQTPVKAWALAVLMALGAAVLTALAVNHKDHARGARELAQPVHRVAPRPEPAPEPVVQHEPKPAPKPDPAPVAPPVRHPAPQVVKPATYCLSLETDLRPAFLSVDGAPFVPLPVKELNVTAGKHNLLIKAAGRSRREQVDERVTRAPCVEQVILFRGGKR